MRRIILISLFLGLAVLPSLAGAADIPARVFETGTNHTPVPVPDIKVDVLAGKGFKKLISSSTSGFDGTCFLGGVPLGKDLLVRLTKQGYFPQYIIRSFSEDDLKEEVALWTASESNITRVFQNLGETFLTHKAHAYVDVSDGLTGEGIEGIHLTASTGKAFDLGGGEYLISNAEGASLRIGIQKPGYAFDIDSVTIPLFPGAFTQYDVKIQSEGAISGSFPAQQAASASITGFIRRLSDAAPVAGLSVAFTFIRGGPKGTTAQPSVQTDAAGFYSQSGFLIGDRIRVTPIGEGFKFKPFRKKVKVKAGGAVADFKADPPAVSPPPPPPPPRVVTINVTLTGAQEVPPVTTPATGIGTLTVNLDTRSLSGSFNFSGLTSNATAAHIHQGAAGIAGGILIPLEGGGVGLTSGTFSVPANTVLSQDQFNLLQLNQLYVNIHSVNFQAGEIRGQIIYPSGSPNFIVITTPLTGGEEVPPVTTTGTATGILNVDLNTGTITGSVAFLGLSSGSTVAHIHPGAASVEGAFIVSLLPSFEGGIGGPSGTFFIPPSTVLTPAQLDLLRTNQLYWNIHSVNFPDGELRGQILFPGGS